MTIDLKATGAIPAGVRQALGLSYGVTLYGAAGNGVADDTAEIQAAIDAASAAGGGEVFFPEGTYKITEMTLQSNVSLRGASAGSTTVRLADSSAHGVITYAEDESNITISDLTFHGGSQSVDQVRLQFDNCTDVTVERCVFTNTKQAIWFLNGGARLRVLDNKFDSVVDHAVRANSGTITDLWIERNYIADVTAGIASDVSAFRIDAERAWVRDNYVAASDDTGIMVAGSSNRDVVVSGNTVRSALVCVFAGTGAKRTRVIGNDLASTDDFGVHVYDATQAHAEVVVADNIIHDCGKSGVEVEGVQGVAITGNLIERVGTDTGAADNERAGVAFVAIGGTNVAKSVVIGNTIRDDAGSPTMRYGIFYQSASTDTFVMGNSVANALAGNYSFGTLTAPYFIQTDTNTTTSGHITSAGASPSIAVAAGAGTGASASVTGTDTAGLIQLNAGTGTSTGLMFTVTFAASYGSTPKAMSLTPASPGAEAARAYTAVDATTLTALATVAPGASASHFWYYTVIG